MTSFDYIIVGAGASGLLLADALGKDPHFANCRILLLEKTLNKDNDRTWCFWETGEGEMDELLHASWPRIVFRGTGGEHTFPIGPYRYKMIRSSKLYTSLFSSIAGYPNVFVRNEEVVTISNGQAEAVVKTKTGRYSAPWIFSSMFSWQTLQNQQEYPVLQQHFKGWFVRTKTPVFDPEAATFMDFSVAQRGNTRFMYLLPFSETEALVEYTLFSADLLPEAEYDREIDAYLRDSLHCEEYEILETEKGQIPMTCYEFASQNSSHIMHIGTAGGWTKPSTGYTFRNSLVKTRELVAYLKLGKLPVDYGAKTRYWWYDLLLLDILYHSNEKGSAIFSALFEKRDPALILKFLDEETTIWEDLKVIWACPKAAFLKALARRLFR